MKNGKKPTVREMEYLKSLLFNPSNWLISKKTSEYWVIVHRVSGNIRKTNTP